MLLDEVDEGEAALADLAEDAEAALIDPHVAAASRCIVEGVEPRDGAAHPRRPSPSRRRTRARVLVTGDCGGGGVGVSCACFVGSMLSRVHQQTMTLRPFVWLCLRFTG